jgi:phosphoribosylanthranilate isomerase
MRRVRVKIEGLRDPQTAVAVARLGADAIGLVFADSPRRVTPQQAREIVAAVPPAVATIGVFVNATADEINQVVELTGIGIVQLHGDEPPTLAYQVRRPCIKAFRVRDEKWIGEVKRWVEGLGSAGSDSCEAARGESGFLETVGNKTPQVRKCTALLDAYHPAVRGGSGRQFNWDLIARSRERGEMTHLGPIILAGGLDAACVGEAIRKVRPWGVDVASGVESAPGVKDLGKVKAFIEAVRAASQD